MSETTEAYTPVFAFVACTLIWGSTWAVIKIGLAELGPLTSVGLRLLLASAIMFLTAAVMRIPPLRSVKDVAQAFVVGLLLFGFNLALVYYAEQYIATGTVSLLFSSVPLITGFLGQVFLHEKVRPVQIGGMLLGIVGVGVLLYHGILLDISLLVPMLATIGAATCASAGTVVVRSQKGAIHPVALNSVGMLAGGVTISSLAILTGEKYTLPRTLPGILSVVYLAVFGSVVGFLLYFWLLRRWPAAKTSLVVAVLPLIAVLIGIAFLGEQLRLETVVGGAMVVVGVYLAMRQ